MPLEPESVYALVGRGARVLVERALGEERVALHDEGERRFLEHYGSHCLDATAPFPGWITVLDELGAAGVVFSVVTNKPEALARRILDGLDLSRRLIAIVGGDTFPKQKPDPAGVEQIRRQVGAEPADSLMVGDSAIDVATARAGGIACCGALWGLDPRGLRAAEPDFLAESAAEVGQVIRG